MELEFLKIGEGRKDFKDSIVDTFTTTQFYRLESLSERGNLFEDCFEGIWSDLEDAS